MIGSENVIVQRAARPARAADPGGFKNIIGPDQVGRPKHFPTVEARPAGEPGWSLTVVNEEGVPSTVYLTDAEARAIASQLPGPVIADPGCC